jgi:hypothetical protein
MKMTEGTGQGTQGNGSGNGEAEQGAGSASGATAKPPEGKVEAEKHGYASELVAYRVVANLALAIANRVETALKNDDDARILLVDNLEYATGGLALTEIKVQTREIARDFDGREQEQQELLESADVPTRLVPAPSVRPLVGGTSFIPIAAKGASVVLKQIPEALGTIADVLAYFDSNYRISGRQMSVANQALLYATAGNLAGRDLTAFIPSFYQVEDSPLLRALINLARQAARLKIGRDALANELPETEQELPRWLLPDSDEAHGRNARERSADNPGVESTTEPPDQERLAKVARVVRETDAVLLAYEGFRTVWMTTPDHKGQGENISAATPTTTPAAKPADSMEPSKLAQALIHETIKRHKVTHLLCLSHFSSGGETTIRERFSVLSDREGFMGGAAAGYVLAGTDGTILAADTFAQFGIVGGTINEMAQGRNFETIDYKPDIAHGRY